MRIQIVHAETPPRLAHVRTLFGEYIAGLGVDLGFQGFEEEAANLPGKYAPPKGAILLAVAGPHAAGCVAIRDLGEGACEMKRLFVRPAYRGRGLGRRLAVTSIEEARRIGYQRMRLDTLATLREAMGLYESLGFGKTNPYYENPLPDVVYWELQL
jgi:ribosomal protein S18 acetylase RimI-like enzyme